MSLFVHTSQILGDEILLQLKPQYLTHYLCVRLSLSVSILSIQLSLKRLALHCLHVAQKHQKAGCVLVRKSCKTVMLE